MGHLQTWLFVVACAGLGSVILFLAYKALQEARKRDQENRRFPRMSNGADFLSSAMTLGSFGVLLWTVSVAVAGITLLHH